MMEQLILNRSCDIYIYTYVHDAHACIILHYMHVLCISRLTSTYELIKGVVKIRTCGLLANSNQYLQYLDFYFPSLARMHFNHILFTYQRERYLEISRERERAGWMVFFKIVVKGGMGVVTTR